MSVSKQVVRQDIRMKLGSPCGASVVASTAPRLQRRVGSCFLARKNLDLQKLSLSLRKSPNPLKSARVSQKFLAASQREFINPCKILENTCRWQGASLSRYKPACFSLPSRAAATDTAHQLISCCWESSGVASIQWILNYHVHVHDLCASS